MTQEETVARLPVPEKIRLYEKNGWFDRDVENDPPTLPLLPGTVDFTGRKFTTRAATFIANRVAYAYFERLIARRRLIIRKVVGAEHLSAVADGCIVTCNHFHPYDQYAAFRALLPILPKKQLYKVIREGNYTNFPGLYGYFFRHCNTLPLSENLHVLGELNRAVETLLSRGEKILVYPEQALWTNYKKPRPLKEGAFRFAARSGKPVLPLFITMQESGHADAEGRDIPAYTVHILPPILPDPARSLRENCREMKEKNETLWKETYEAFYKIPLSYEV